MARALISVSDKTGVIDAATRLQDAGFEIVATGGTASAISDAGIPVREVSDVTGFPEILQGRVKTLHPAIHAGLLARRDQPDHQATLQEHDITHIDVLVSNLYPFAQVVGREQVTDEEAIENIDIGGPAMLRAGAKNFQSVIVLVDPADYAGVLAAIESGGVEAVDIATRRRLAARAFAHVSAYDALVTSYLRAGEAFPPEFSVGARLLSEVRYGENPHQRAAIYTVPSAGPPAGIATWSVDQGKEMSYNNYLDGSAAWGCVQQFGDPAVVIVKHTIPCGVGTAANLSEAYLLALSGDPVSAFGGVFAANREVDEATVDEIAKLRLDVMIAPGYADEALERLRRRRNLRIVTVGNTTPPAGWEVRSVPGGLLVQEPDRIVTPASEWKVATERQPTSEELRALEFAWKVVPWVKSNAIVLAQDGVVTGVGAGQPNRVESVRLAVKVAGEQASGSVLASDAFFPFPDGVEEAGWAGVTAIVQPGGSVRDDECIAAANAAGIAMLFSGERHFRH